MHRHKILFMSFPEVSWVTQEAVSLRGSLFPTSASQDKWEWGCLSRQPAGRSGFDVVLRNSVLDLKT